MNKGTPVRTGIYQSSLVRRVAAWMDAIPRPLVACEIAPDYVAAARWSRRGQSLEDFAVEPIPAGAIVPTAAETNLLDAAEVRAAASRVLRKVHSKENDEVALLIPDAVIPVFVLHFDSFPRKKDEALPMLRWRLKKSVPFEADETLISYMRQSPREDGVDIVTSLARQGIIREYESVIESLGMVPGVVISSTLATVPLIPDGRAALLARAAGTTLTTAIVREGVLCGYRCITLPTDVHKLTPQALLDEIFPLTAFYQDSWSEGISQVQLAGLGERTAEFVEPLRRELRCPVGTLLAAAAAEGLMRAEDRPLAEHGLEALIGWRVNAGA